MLFLGLIYVLYYEVAPRWHTHNHATNMSTRSWGGMSNWYGEDGEGATMKRRGTMVTKTMSQDDTNADNEKTDNSKNNESMMGIRG